MDDEATKANLSASLRATGFLYQRLAQQTRIDTARCRVPGLREANYSLSRSAVNIDSFDVVWPNLVGSDY